MLAAFATLAFLVTLWLTVVVAAEVLAETGGKIMAALKGNSQLATATVRAPVAVRVSQRSVSQQRTVRAQPRFRAAA